MDAQYMTQGKCDYCDARPGELVNHLVPCACWSGVGAPWQSCNCAYGVIERRKARKAAEKAAQLEAAADTPRPPRLSSREPEGSVSVGVGRVKAPEGARLTGNPTQRP